MVSALGSSIKPSTCCVTLEKEIRPVSERRGNKERGDHQGPSWGVGGGEVPQRHSGRIPLICGTQRMTSLLAEVRVAFVKYVFISPWRLASEWRDFKTNVKEGEREISRR